MPIDAIIDRTSESQDPGYTQNFEVKFQPDNGVTPDGSETPVNIAFTDAPQNTQLGGRNVSVSGNTQGSYVVGWENFATGEVYARAFNANGTDTGDLLVGAGNPGASFGGGTQPPTYNYPMPNVAMAGNGEFMVAWNGPNGIQAQVYSIDGMPVGSTSTVLAFNSKTTGDVSGVAADATGDFVVVYSAATLGRFGPSTPTVYAQRYTASGAKNGREIKVATPQLSTEFRGVAMDGAGDFVVAWNDAVSGRQTTSTTYLYAQEYTASGSKLGSQIIVASSTTASGMPLVPSVAMNATGQFVVAYQPYGTGQGVAQVYNANGTRAGAAVTFTNNEQGGDPAAVAMDSAGDIMFSWTSTSLADSNGPGHSSPYSRNQVRMAWLQAGASAVTDETIVNTTTQGSHQLPGVAAIGNNTFMVAWQGYGDADPAGIYSQKYIPATPTGSAPLQSVFAASIAGTSSVSGASGTTAPLPGNAPQSPSLSDVFAAGFLNTGTPALSHWSALPTGAFGAADGLSQGATVAAQQQAAQVQILDQVFAELVANRRNHPFSA